MTGTRFAHFTDLHLPAPAPPGLRDLLGKRALGHLSWQSKRQWRHALSALEALAEDRRRQQCDIDIITGDVVNISLPSEFVAARKWLMEHFNSERTVLAPGNHDAYVRVRWADGLGHFSAYMRGVRHDDPEPRPPQSAADFPFVRVVGDVCFIVLNSAAPTGPGLATGRLGAAQLARLRQELTSAADAGLCRVIALHHPVAKGVVSRRKGLDDGPALRALLAETGAELVIHGHAHRPTWSVVETPRGPRPAVGGGSASHSHGFGHYTPARYTLFSIARAPDGGWRIGAIVRQLDPADRTVKTVEERRLL